MTGGPKPSPGHIGPYRVLWGVARGGMAEVFEVEDPTTGEHLALKLLVNDHGAFSRFNREYQAMTRLNHPNIVRVYRYGLHQGMPWLTMELLNGRPVAAWAKRLGRPGSRERTDGVMRVLYEVARALDHSHRRSLVHRDVKSANVLVLADGRPKLLDFGSARLDDAPGITAPGEFIGTFEYAAPEQIMQRPVDHRADLYSLGVLAYRLLSGRLPFRDKDQATLARRHVRDAPDLLDALVPGLPRRLVELVHMLLEKDPDKRPGSARRFANALEPVAGAALEPPGTLEIDTRMRLIGREDQLSRLRRFLDDGVPASAALVIGRHGSGAQRLVEVVEGEARERGWPTFRANFGASSDLAPMVRMLRRMSKVVVDATFIDEAEQELAHADAATFGTTRRAAFGDAAVAVVRAVVRRSSTPVLCVLRDLEQASPAALDLLSSLLDVASKSGQRLLFVADCDEIGRGDLGALRRALPAAVRVRVAPLTASQVSHLVGALLHRRPPPAALARRIHAVSAGRPAYVEEVVADLVGRGLLRLRGSDPNRVDWAQDVLEVTAPKSALSELRRTLGALPVDRLRVLEVLALLEGEGDDRVLARALERRTTDVSPALTDLRDRGVVTLDEQEGRIRVQWLDRLAEGVVLEGLHDCRRDVLQRRLLEVLEGAPPFAAQIRLRVAGGELPVAVAAAISLGEHYLAAYQPETALAVLDEVVARAREASDVPRVALTRLHILHSSCLLMARPTDMALGRSMARAATLARGSELEADVELVRARAQRAIGHYVRFREHLLRGWELASAQDRPALSSSIAVQLGDALRLAGEVGKAAEWYDKGSRLARSQDRRLLAADARVGIGWLHLLRGRVAEAEAVVERAVRVFDEHDDLRGQSLALPLWSEALRRQGRFSEALARLAPLAAELRDGQAPSFYVRAVLAQGWIELDLCRFGRVQELVDELAAILRRGEHLHLRLEADLLRAHILLESDQPFEARVVADGVARRAEAGALHPFAARARALMAAVEQARGDSASSTLMFAAACTRLQHLGDMMALADAVVLRARWQPTAVRPRELFAPLLPTLREQPLLPLELERSIARVRYLEARGADAKGAREHGQAVLERVRSSLADTDRAALRVHPWTDVIPLRDDGSGVLR